MKKNYLFYLMLLIAAFEGYSAPLGDTSNEAPTISGIADQSTCKNVAVMDMTFTVSDVETPAANLTVVATSSNTTLIPNGNIYLGGSGAARTISVNPVDGLTGIAIITVTVTDGNGVDSDISFVVTVGESDDPTVMVKDIMVQLDATGSVTITADDVDDGSYSDCGIDTMTLDKYTFTCDDVNTDGLLVTLTVIDKSGNSSEGYAFVSVEDTTAPHAVAKNFTVQLDEEGNASITVEDIDNGSTDNCGVYSIELDRTEFTCADVATSAFDKKCDCGGNMVTLTVTDNNGLTSQAHAFVTVQDVTPATVFTQDFEVELDENGNASITAEDIDYGSSDSCGGNVSLELNVSSFTCNELGENTVALKVTDERGNVSEGTATVLVKDVTPPTVLTRNFTVELNAQGYAVVEAEDIDNGSTDNCGIAELVLDNTFFTCDNLGENTVILTVTDASGNSSFAEATITVILPVIDDIPTTISLGVDATITLESIITGGNWWSSDNGVAEVNPITGEILGVGAGTCDIIYEVLLGGCNANAIAKLTVSNLANNQFDLSKLNYYPNPVANVLNVTNINTIQTISVSNMLGQELMTQSVNATMASIDMTSFTAAAYMVKVTTENGVKIIRVIKQ